jgi:predicted flavoprotein YhiN
MNVIANKILKKCNVINKKNKNNNKSLITGDGKLMITNGMTLAEFEKRFNLNG